MGSGRVDIIVQDAMTGQRVSNAYVKSDGAGTFNNRLPTGAMWKNVFIGAYNFTISAPGYETQQLYYDFNNGSVLTVNLSPIVTEQPQQGFNFNDIIQKLQAASPLTLAGIAVGLYLVFKKR